MTLFVDASALVALAADEPERAVFAARIAADEDPLWSAMARWEAIAALCRSYELKTVDARQRITDFADASGLRMVPIGGREADCAHEAYVMFGKGRHKAGLNMGDCFAYACAKANDARLLYKGNDFAETDLA